MTVAPFFFPVSSGGGSEAMGPGRGAALLAAFSLLVGCAASEARRPDQPARRLKTSEAASDALPVLALRSYVVLPGEREAIHVGRPQSMALFRQVHIDQLVGIVTQKDREVAEPRAKDLYEVGTLARVVGFMVDEQGRNAIAVEGISRFRLEEIVEEYPYLQARVALLPEPKPSRAAEELARALREGLYEMMQRHELPAEAIAEIRDLLSGLPPGRLADSVAKAFGTHAEMQEMLMLLDAESRLERALRLLAERLTRNESIPPEST